MCGALRRIVCKWWRWHVRIAHRERQKKQPSLCDLWLPSGAPIVTSTTIIVSLRQRLKKFWQVNRHQEATAALVRTLGAIPACITRAEARRLLTRFFATCDLPVATEAC